MWWTAVAGTAVAAVVVTACSTASAPAPTTTSAPPGSAVRTVTYARHPEAVIDIHAPAVGDPTALVVLLHGGFWLEQFRRDLMTPLAEDLASRGFVAANIEYRRVGGGGGHPETMDDVIAALEHLSGEDALRGLPVALVGHSAGGHLALWAASDGRLAEEPCLVVSQSGITDLFLGFEQHAGRGAVDAFMGGPPGEPGEEAYERYRGASPRHLTPPRAPVVLVHPSGDTIVRRDQSATYAEWLATGGGVVSLVEPAGDHFAHLDPASEAWAAVTAALGSACG